MTDALVEFRSATGICAKSGAPGEQTIRTPELFRSLCDATHTVGGAAPVVSWLCPDGLAGGAGRLS